MRVCFICALRSLAGKGLTSWLSFVVSAVSLSFSHWYPGSGVVLDCIDSSSLHPYLLCHFPIGILGQVCYLIVSIPDLCTLTCFYEVRNAFLSLYAWLGEHPLLKFFFQ